MPLINPDNLRLASVACTACDVELLNPSAEDEVAFSAAHIHGNETLQAWFDARTRK